MLYMNSMIQEKTGASACEILFGRNPNLPSDISFTPVTSLSNDREGYVKQLKRDLKDIRQKLSQVLGQDMDQNANPFKVGEKVIIAILPHENAIKLMAKWKGPFIITKIPNRFQIEYMDGNIMRLTQIRYAKKYNERCHHTEQMGMPRSEKVSKRQAWVRMAHIRLIAGTGCRKVRMVATSVKAIQDNWGIKEGRIRVQVLGEVGDLPADLKAIVDAAGPELCIEGSALVDLCVQRSSQRGSGCDAPSEGEELPLAMETSPTPSILPAVKVRQNSCHYSAKNNIFDIRREFVGTNKRINYVPHSIPQQASSVTRVHLMKLVGRIGKRERSKGKNLTENISKVPHLSNKKVMTSLLFPGQKAEERNAQSSLNKSTNSSEIGLAVHKYPYMNHTVLGKGLGGNKKGQEVESRLVGTTVCDVMDDAIITSPDGHNQETRWDADKNRLVARKRRVTRKGSFIHSIGNIGRSLMNYCRTITFVALLLATIINVTEGLVNIRPSEGKSIVGNSPTNFK